MTPKLSIVIPVYNTELYLKECLDSIINQTLKDIEIIIVNDCSPDNSESIILEYQAKYPCIKYIKHQQNLRQGGARNTGIQNAIGEWITFIDSDDYIDPNIYKKILEQCETENTQFGAFLYQEFPKKDVWSADPQILGLIKINQNNLANFPLGPVCKIYRRKDIVDHDILFPENIFLEDVYFWWKYVVCLEPKSSFLDEVGYYYRRTDTSTMGDISNTVKYLPVVLNLVFELLLQEDKWDQYQDIFCLVSQQQLFHYMDNISNDVSQEYIKKSVELIKKVEKITPNMDHYPFLSLLIIEEFDLDTKIKLYATMNKIRSNTPVPIINDKWYNFGQLSRKQKLKKIVIVISKKLKIYPILKKTYKIVRK